VHLAPTPFMKPIRIVCGTRASRDEFLQRTALGRSLSLIRFEPQPQVLLFPENKAGLSTIYNIAIERAKTDPAILIFVHDDVHFCDFFWPTTIREAVERFDVVGLAGNKRRVPAQPGWAFVDTQFTWDQPEHLSGVVGHGKGFPCDIVSAFGAPGQACKLLDGLLLAGDSTRLNEAGIKFDEQFAFHFYDMDFCRQAEQKGLTMGTWPLSVVHESGGAFGSPAWRDAYQRYLQKYTS
jgi:GT2 family glycosyltransferase